MKQSKLRKFNHSFIAVVAFLAMLMVEDGCKKKSDAPTPTPGPNEVWMQNTAFNPSTITVSKGTTVKWTNKDGMTHTVTSDVGFWDSGNINANGVFTHAFDSAGTFSYSCLIHSSMHGKVIVN